MGVEVVRAGISGIATSKYTMHHTNEADFDNAHCRRAQSRRTKPESEYQCVGEKERRAMQASRQASKRAISATNNIT